MKRKIKSHKGGRDASLYVRLNADLRDKLKRICKQLGISQADWIEEQIKKAKENNNW